MKKITVVISNDNTHAVTDWNVESWAESLKDGDTAYVATSCMFNELRVAVSKGVIEPFHFDFNGELFHVGEKGELEPYWANGFFDQAGIQVKQLMGMTREKAEESTKKLHQRALERLAEKPNAKQREIAVERYKKDYAWRKAWNSLMNNHELMKKRYPLQSQMEYIERRAELANQRIAKLIPILKST